MPVDQGRRRLLCNVTVSGVKVPQVGYLNQDGPRGRRCWPTTRRWPLGPTR